MSPHRRNARGLTRAALAAVVVAGAAVWERPARAWDDFGHMEVAAAAFKKLHATTRQNVARLLKMNPRYTNWIVGARRGDEDRMAFMRAATWADSIKMDPRYKDDTQSAPTAAQNVGYGDLLRHGYWHFIDQPFSPDGTPLVPAAAPNVATQIAAFRAALAAPETSDDVKSYDLVWLLHLVGDAHQPLHCVSRYDAAQVHGDRGGNLVRIIGNTPPPVCDDPRYCPFGPPNELHAFYDDIAGAGYAVGPVESAADHLPAADAKRAAVADEKVWIQEGLDLAQSAVYVLPIGVGEGPFAVTPQYQQAAADLGRRRIALAGARLANLLNTALGQ
ncbi:MAG TPA: S1/P1 nuclease [Polyangia bacterium]|nr:S1/P1 nuclease [Polyangia bacterium]